MLDNGVAFTALGCNGQNASGDLLRIHYYNFKVSTNNIIEKYTVEFHEYNGELFIGKYFPTRLSKESDKYYTILDNGVRFACIVLKTVTDIFLHVYEKHPKASFGFIGEQRIFIEKNERQGFFIRTPEGSDSTKRFDLYKLMCYRDINPDDFYYAEIKTKSAILMVNVKVGNKKEYIENVEKMMIKNYIYFENQSTSYDL